MIRAENLSHRQPQGAYVELKDLQQLRYFAKQCAPSTNGKSRALLGGQHNSHALSRGMEFQEVRPYQAGDDIRSIDWRVTARTQVTHSKRYTEEKEKPIITVVDQRQSAFFGSSPCFKSVYSCHLAAIINWATLQSGDRSGGIVLGTTDIKETRPARSHKTVNRWLHQLSESNHQLSVDQARTPTLTPTQIPEQTQTSDATLQEPHFSELLERIAKTTQTGTQVYIISDFYDLDTHCEKLLFQIARHHQITLIWVVDQLEVQLPKATQLNISNGQSNSPVVLQPRLADAFSQHYQTKKAYLEGLAQRLRLRLIHASVQTPPIDVVQYALNGKKVGKKNAKENAKKNGQGGLL